MIRRLVLLVSTVTVSVPALWGANIGSTSTPVVVVELFTSEGCLSCIPAERLAISLDTGSQRGKNLVRNTKARRGTPLEVIVLGEHVDYFDNQAWTDLYSSPLFSARQQDYGIALHRAVMYTPQLIVNGQYEVNDARLETILPAIREASRTPRAPVYIAFIKEDQIVLRVGKLPQGSHTSDILLAIAESGLEVKIGGGENKDTTLAHAPVVRSLTRVGEIDPKRPGEFTAEARVNLNPQWTRANLRLVLFVQDRTTRRILGAAAVDLQPPKAR